MHRFLFLFWLVPCCATLHAADELAVVTAEIAPLLSETGQVADRVSLFEALDVTGQKDTFVVVQRDGQTFRIHRGLVHRTSQFDDIPAAALDGLRQVFAQLKEANRLLDEEQYPQASEAAQQAAQQARQTFAGASTWEMWALQFQAFVLIRGEQIDDAAAVLNQCLALMKECEADEQLHAADVFNTVGILKDAQGDSDAAVRAYRRALLIALKHLGHEHHDTAVIRINEALLHQAADNLLQAVQLQQLVLTTLEKVLPASSATLAQNWVRLGQFQRDHEDHTDAIASFNKAAELYVQHHPDRLVELADNNTDLIYSHTQLGNFAQAEAVCLSNLQLVLQMEEGDRRDYQRDALLRQGTIDFERGDYQAAIHHYTSATALYDAETPAFDDAVAQEALGDSHLELAAIAEAVAAYEKGLKLFAATVGSESDEVLNLRDHIYTHADIPYEASAAYCQAAMPEAVMTDADGRILATIPGLTILPVLASDANNITVKYEDQEGFVTTSQLHLQRNIPGYGLGQQADMRPIMLAVQQAQQGLQSQNARLAEDRISAAQGLCLAFLPADSSLLMWLNLREANILLRTRGVATAAKQIDRLKDKVEALNPESYPLFLDLTQSQAALLSAQNKPQEAAALLLSILEDARERYGDNHAVVSGLENRIGIALMDGGQQDEAVKHLRAAHQIARRIYPESSATLATAVSDFANRLMNLERYASGAEVIEQYLTAVPHPPQSAHALIVATLGKAYGRLDRKREARDLLTAIINLPSDADARNRSVSIARLIACYELGRVELADNNWQAAADALQAGLAVANNLKIEDSLDVAEGQRKLAFALQMLDDDAGAMAALRDAARIFELHGEQSGSDAQAVQKQLAALEHAAAAPATAPVDVQAVLAALMNLTPAGEQMYRTTAATGITAEPSAQADRIGQLKAETDIWSLEEQAGFHRIYSPDQQQFGWVAATDVRLRSAHAAEKGEQRLKEELWFFQLTPALKAFEAGMSVTDEDPRVEIEVLKKSLATIASKYKVPTELTGLLHERLMSAYRKAGDSDSIALLADEALSPALSAHGFHHPHSASIRQLLAESKSGVGDYFGAETERRYVVEACEKRFGPDDPRTLMQRLQHAAMQIRTGEFAAAEQTYQSVAGVTGTDSASVFLRASAEMGLGLLRATERNHTAARHLETALTAFDSLNHPVPSLSVQSAMALAAAVFDAGEGQEAVEILDRVEGLPLSASEVHIRVALWSLKARLLAGVDPSRSMEVAARAIELSNESFGEANILQVDALSAQGIARAMAGEAEAAADSFHTARQLAYVFGDLLVSYQDTNHQLSFAAADGQRLDAALRLALVADSPKVTAASAEWLINGHAAKTQLLGKRAQISATLDLKSNPALFLWEYDQQQTAGIPLQNIKHASPSVAARYETLKQQAKDRRATLPSATEQLIAAPPQWVDLATIRRSLASDETLVLIRRLQHPEAYHDTFRYQLMRDEHEAAYVAWVVPAADNEPVELVFLGDVRRIDSLIEQLHEHLSATASRASARSPLLSATRRETGLRRELGERVWEPLEASLPEDCRAVTIVADGLLCGVPWDALTLPGGESVLDRYATRVVSDPRYLVRSSPQLTLSQPALFVRPDRMDRSLDALPLTRTQSGSISRRSGGSRLHFDKLELQRFVHNRRTIVNSMFARFSDDGESVPTGDAAAAGRTSVHKIWEALFEGDPRTFAEGKCSQIGFYLHPRPQALHIEAAPFVRPQVSVALTADFLPIASRRLIPRYKLGPVNPLANCGLLVAGAAATGVTSFIINDGVFTGEEITGLDLRGTRLVTLSVAPRSPDGSAAPAGAGDDLVSAFQLAGAETVLSGLWPLDEHHADAVLQRFYLRLREGLSFADALRTAQQDIRQQQGGRVSAAFWASFRVNGKNGRLVDTDQR